MTRQGIGIEEAITVDESRFDRTRKTIGLIAGPILFAFIYVLPMPGLSLGAHRLAAILLLVVTWWITEAIPIPMTALAGPVLAVLLGVDAAKKVFGSFADPVIFLFIGSFIIAETMARHRLDQRIAYSILSLPGVGRSSRSVLFVFGLIAVVLSMWVSNTATTAMLLPIGLGILNTMARVHEKETGRKLDPKTMRYSTALMLMAAYGASVGGIGTPVGTPPNLIGIGLIRNLLDININFLQWMRFAVPMALVMYGALYVLLLVLHKPEIERIETLGSQMKAARIELGPMTPGERNVLIAFLVTVVLWVTPGFVGAVWGRQAPLAVWYEAHLPEATAALVGSLLLFLMPVDWKRREATATLKEFIAVDWGTIILFGGGLALGALMFSTGLAEAIGKGIFSLTGARSLFMITAVATALSIVFSELTSNTAAANMVIPVMISLAQAAGVNPLMPALAACIGASFGFMLPVSTPPNAIVYGSGLVPITRMVRAGILFDVIGFFVVLFGLFVLLPAAGIK